MSVQTCWVNPDASPSLFHTGTFFLPSHEQATGSLYVSMYMHDSECLVMFKQHFVAGQAATP